MDSLIYKIDRLNTHNGPGFRTVVYFKGCPLHCTWCHNPEGISPKPEVWFNAVKCIGCGSCVEECSEKALKLDEKGIHIDRNACTGCQHCVDVCPSRAMEAIGKRYTVHDLMRIMKQDKMLFDSSGGGATATGGEPGSQAEFVAKLFKECQAVGIHTALDTSGIVGLTSLDKILPYVNLVFLDIKILEDEKSISYTGLPVQKLLKTMEYLNTYQKKNPKLKIEIRTPLIPRVNDDNESLISIANLIKGSFNITPSWELCLFNDLCEDKYNRMNMKWSFKDMKHNSGDYSRFRILSNSLAVKPFLTGFVDKG